MRKAGIIVVSDKCFVGERIDTAGEAIIEILNNNGYATLPKIIVPDEIDMIEDAILKLCKTADIVFTTGGTGFSVRDVTPEATRKVIEREAPGICEAIRMRSLQITDRAMLSRGVSGIRGKTLIINLSGSEKAVREGLDIVLNAVGHGLDILLGTSKECGRK